MRRAGWGPPGRRPTAPTTTPASWSVVVIGRLPHDRGGDPAGPALVAEVEDQVRQLALGQAVDQVGGRWARRRSPPAIRMSSGASSPEGEPALRLDRAASRRPRGRRARRRPRRRRRPHPPRRSGPCTTATRSPNARSRSVAIASASGSRSTPTTSRHAGVQERRGVPAGAERHVHDDVGPGEQLARPRRPSPDGGAPRSPDVPDEQPERDRGDEGERRHPDQRQALPHLRAQLPGVSWILSAIPTSFLISGSRACPLDRRRRRRPRSARSWPGPRSPCGRARRARSRPCRSRPPRATAPATSAVPGRRA